MTGKKFEDAFLFAMKLFPNKKQFPKGKQHITQEQFKLLATSLKTSNFDEILDSYQNIIPEHFERFQKYLKRKKYEFTDDTVLTIATMKALLEHEMPSTKDIANVYHTLANRYPDVGYGPRFKQWFKKKEVQPPYGSWGNGSAMRVSPIAFTGKSHNYHSIMRMAYASAEVTHNAPQAMRGAAIVAHVIYSILNNENARDNKDEIISTSCATIMNHLGKEYDYDLTQSMDDIKRRTSFAVECHTTVPRVLIAVKNSSSSEEIISNCIAYGLDQDTDAMIGGCIGEAIYGKPSDEIISYVRERLTSEMVDVVDRFYEKFLGYAI